MYAGFDDKNKCVFENATRRLSLVGFQVGYLTYLNDLCNI
jgi:hypothetical protein